MPRALITGITGQDGMYLAEFLTAKGYGVFGLVRGQTNPKIAAVRRAVPSIRLLAGDLRDLPSLVDAMEIAQPDEVYNLGAISSVGFSWKQAELTSEITGLGVLRILEAVRIHTRNDMSKVRFCQASSSEMFGAGGTASAPQHETTVFNPRSPYGAAKAFGHYTTMNYRESYGAYACSGILFDHESPRRSPESVTRKITQGVARIALGQCDRLTLGDLDARRDWGFAGDYVEAMWLMLQQDVADDYVIATGEAHSVREVVDISFNRVGIANWERHVRRDPRQSRSPETSPLLGDAAKARERLGWRPRVGFRTVIEMMLDTDLANAKRAI
jgi:GDPmannose 4,6-dehydratase